MTDKDTIDDFDDDPLMQFFLEIGREFLFNPKIQPHEITFEADQRTGQLDGVGNVTGKKVRQWQ